MKGTGAKRNVCPGSCVSTGAKFPVAPVESAPGVRCRLAYGPTDATATLSLASVKSRLVLPFWYRLTWVVPEKGSLNVCVCVCDQRWKRGHACHLCL